MESPNLETCLVKLWNLKFENHKTSKLKKNIIAIIPLGLKFLINKSESIKAKIHLEFLYLDFQLKVNHLNSFFKFWKLMFSLVKPLVLIEFAKFNKHPIYKLLQREFNPQPLSSASLAKWLSVRL